MLSHRLAGKTPTRINRYAISVHSFSYQHLPPVPLVVKCLNDFLLQRLFGRFFTMHQAYLMWPALHAGNKTQ